MSEIKMRKPSGWAFDLWREALPVGNGKTSALLCGSVGIEHIWVNRYDRWENGEESELPDVRETLPQTRQDLKQGNYAEANQRLANALRSKGYSTKLAAPMAPIELRLRFDCDKPYQHYRRGIDFQTGEAYARFLQGDKEQQRRLFVSRADDEVVFEVLSEEAFSLKLDKFTDDRLKLAFTVKDGTATDKGEYYEIRNTHQLTVYVKFDSEPAAEPYESMRDRHLPAYRSAMGNADLILSEDSMFMEDMLDTAMESGAPTALFQQLWQFGHYLFASGTCEDGYPFPLYGLWNGTANAPWAQHVANENVEMIYWHAPTGGFASLLKPLIHYYYGKMDAFREAAQKLFGCRGIYVSTYTTPLNSLPAPNVPVIVNYIGCAGWLCRHFFDYYKYTGDEELLNREILPFMLETARFYEDYLFRDENGNICIMPSVSPENTPGNFMPEDFREHMGHINPVVWNSTMDFGILKSLLNSLLEISRDHPLDEARIEVWKQILKDIPDYMVNAQGAIREWMSEDLSDYYKHRHLSHIFPLFPGEEIDENSPLFDAFKKAVDLRELGGMSGWAFAHMSAIYARMGLGNRALDCLNTFSKGCLLNNGFTLHNDWRDMGVSLAISMVPVQLDALMGCVNAIQEMLLRSKNDECVFLPACPDAFSEGSVRSWKIPGASVDFSWKQEKKLFTASLTAERDVRLRVCFPKWTGKPAQVIRLCAGDKITL